jgi:hypothetical protein
MEEKGDRELVEFSVVVAFCGKAGLWLWCLSPFAAWLCRAPWASHGNDPAFSETWPFNIDGILIAF